jgi:SAM-dependent methyltransferase
MTRDEILIRIRELRPWFHNVPLGDGIFTKDLNDPSNSFPGQNIPWFTWDRIKSVIPSRLTGWQVLDVGCNAGFYSFMMRERGAHVVGIDIDQGRRDRSSPRPASATTCWAPESSFATRTCSTSPRRRRST